MKTFCLRHLANLAFLLGFFSAPPAIAGEVGLSTGATNGQTLSVQLQKALIVQGWTAIDAPDGSVSYLPPARAVVAQATESESESGSAFAAGLRDALEQQGWEAQSDGEGNLIYRKPAPAAVTRDPAPAAQGTLTQQLRGELETLGWNAMHAANGDIFYLPPAAEASPSTIADRLSEELKRQGWVRYTAEDGNVIFRAPARGPAPPVAAAAASPQSGPVASPAHVEQLVRQLQQSGWQVWPMGGDGAILIKPRPHGALPAPRDGEVQGAVGEPGGGVEAGSLRRTDDPLHQNLPGVVSAVPMQLETVEADLREKGGTELLPADSVVGPYPGWHPRPGHPCGPLPPPVRRGSTYWWPAPPAWQQPAWVWPQRGPYPYR